MDTSQVITFPTCIHYTSYEDQVFRYIKLPNKGLLLNTKDICALLQIDERPSDTVLANPCLNLTNAVLLATKDDFAFSTWLLTKFILYEFDTSERPVCDDNWGMPWSRVVPVRSVS